MRILHALHDFLPGHRAGSEIYVFNLCRELAERHQVHVLCAEYEPSQPHASLRSRVYHGLPVTEVVNNWAFPSFAHSYRSAALNGALGAALERTRPDVLHIHNLLNLSLDLPRLAAERGIPCVATLHDYTLFCPSGGQRVHLAEEHVCLEIDPARCSRCFAQTHFQRQMAASWPPAGAGSRASWLRWWRRVAGRVDGRPDPPSRDDIGERWAYVRPVLEAVELFVAPSRALAADCVRFGIPPARVQVSDYGFPPLAPRERRPPGGPLRIGYVGTLVWHKGVHVLLEAARSLPPGTFELLLYGDPGTFPAYAVRLREAGRGLPVRFRGGFAPEDAADVYAQIDVLVVPSLWPENSPLVIHEAFQAGLPVVAARAGGIPELVSHGENGLLYDPPAAAELAAALAGLIQEPERLARMRSHIPAVKGIEKDAREWEGRYGQVLRKWEARASQAR